MGGVEWEWVVYRITYIQLMSKFDLNEWGICNPDHRQDLLPQPYRLVDEVLRETVLHRLAVSMFELEQKKKDRNYEGGVKEYLAQGTIDVENIACLTSVSKHHNHLLAGDKNGTVFLLDLAKKIVFSKKELAASRRVIYIAETFINDGDVSITTLAVVLNGHNKIYILRYKHAEPKLVLTHVVEVASDQNDPNKLPFSCQFSDYGRLLFVYTYDGTISLYKIPEIPIDLNQINKNQTIPLEEQDFKKKLRYPLTYAILQTQIGKISDRMLEIKFQGKKIPLTREQLLAKMIKKVQAPVAEVQIKKDPKKKQQKKVEQEEPQAKEEVEFNPLLKKAELLIQNGSDNTAAYPLPKYRPFVYILHCKLELQKKKEFQKDRFVDIPEKIVYGWTNTKQFRINQLLARKTNYCPNYLYIQHYLQKVPEKFAKEKTDYLNQKLVLKNSRAYKNIYEISATALSLPDQQYLACGLVNGAVTVWSTNTANIIYNTDKHQGAVTALRFFEGWKLISGSSKGEVQIDNIVSLTNEMKRTNIFESKVDYPIASIRVCELGLAFVIDANANLRVYDLWRNEKIVRVQSCNSFAQLENRGKRWVPSSAIEPAVTIYTNNDFTAILSTNWPNYGSRELEESQLKRKEVNTLLGNPWRAKGSNVHVIRNFQFLLGLFQGLQNTYKKGYERKKIENLFTNLEFTQLYDRNFQIPDFGVTNNGGEKGKKHTQVGFGVGSKTHISTRSREKLMKDSSSASQVSRVKYKLTNEVLHPEKFLLERRKVEKEEVITDEKLRSSIRDTYKRQNALENSLTADFSKNLL